MSSQACDCEMKRILANVTRWLQALAPAQPGNHTKHSPEHCHTKTTPACCSCAQKQVPYTSPTHLLAEQLRAKAFVVRHGHHQLLHRHVLVLHKV